jgi:5-methyltetrahydrofolate--homocysteine methyltransferase
MDAMSKILQEIKAGRTLLCDGAMGTQLHRRGLALKTCPESWNLSHPDDVQAISAEYIVAGCDIVETNTLGATRSRLAHYGLADQVVEINRKSARLARRAAGNDHYVFASVGPTGELMKPLGPRSEAEMIGIFAEQMKALAEEGVDAFCIETQIALEEALAAVKAAKENTDLPVAVTLTFNKTPAGIFRTVMGISPDRMVEKLTFAGADVIGSNCGQGPERMVELCRKFRWLTDLPLMFQANAGLPVMENGQTVFKATPQEMAEYAVQIRSAGANIIGGCCGTTPSHIKAMRERLLET